MSSKYGDLMTNLEVFDTWLSYGCSLDWAKETSVNHRALQQAKSIRMQLESLAGKIDKKLTL